MSTVRDESGRLRGGEVKAGTSAVSARFERRSSKTSVNSGAGSPTGDSLVRGPQQLPGADSAARIGRWRTKKNVPTAQKACRGYPARPILELAPSQPAGGGMPEESYGHASEDRRARQRKAQGHLLGEKQDASECGKNRDR